MASSNSSGVRGGGGSKTGAPRKTRSASKKILAEPPKVAGRKKTAGVDATVIAVKRAGSLPRKAKGTTRRATAPETVEIAVPPLVVTAAAALVSATDEKALPAPSKLGEADLAAPLSDPEIFASAALEPVVIEARAARESVSEAPAGTTLVDPSAVFEESAPAEATAPPIAAPGAAATQPEPIRAGPVRRRSWLLSKLRRWTGLRA